jgi:putative SOS response-associated peptidase YedK
MCGRFFLSKSGAEMVRHFDLSEEPVLAPRFNIAPTQLISFVRQRRTETTTTPAVPRSEPQASGEIQLMKSPLGFASLRGNALRSAPIREHHRAGNLIVPRSEPQASGEIHKARARTLEAYSWGFVPHFSKDPRNGPRPINARSETLATSPLFRDAFARRRGLVPASGFYEWQHRGRSSRPFAIRVHDGELFAMAALFDHWEGEGASLDSCAIVTSAANDRVAKVHERMPVILAPADYALWLDPAVQDSERLLPLLRPCPAAWIELHPVESRVNDVRCDDARLAEPERDLFSSADGAS